jgi:hypothetical protein
MLAASIGRAACVNGAWILVIAGYFAVGVAFAGCRIALAGHAVISGNGAIAVFGTHECITGGLFNILIRNEDATAAI